MNQVKRYYKIMDFLDTNVDDNSICVVYGLDADLIMLSMMLQTKYITIMKDEYNIEGSKL